MSPRGMLLLGAVALAGCNGEVRLLDDRVSAEGMAGEGGAVGGTGGSSGGGGAGGTTSSCDCAVPDSCTDLSLCPCPTSTTRCGNDCVDLRYDATACGGCDVACGDAELCEEGECRCRHGLTRCGGACVATSSDPANCGGCDKECGTSCAHAVCNVPCGDDETACPTEDGRQACVHLIRDDTHCGSCDQACSSGTVCIGGECVAYVPITPCLKCPCSECESLVGTGAACCPWVLDVPVCVSGGHCPH